ncbi:hypothetical protein B0F90DRAFT_1732760 [Multifurca ochricompacta]|uniref:Uncharacterized protein n=1 Tax=Multifurca ochricompacta TaxID=376703 RepID=A0AAD4M1K5_9AGAM|nr:hypothetical protein B0F90DRAFT_1732760 [Multifurca ochricompacta]
MTHSNPETFLVWSVLSCLLGIFLVYHLWSFDRFRCLKWNQGSSGGFKRLMTYTYIIGVPLVTTYSIGFCAIKYSEGYIFIPEIGIIPKPHQLWSKSHQKAILPLYLCISLAWGSEMVTHLESLCFLVFLINSGSAQDWFRSWYFRIWAIGGFIAVTYLPLITIFTRSDPVKCEAYTFLAGSVGSLLLTISYAVVLPRFKPFLQKLREQGVDMSVIIRLMKFRELTIIYLYSRTLSAIPLLILSADGVRSTTTSTSRHLLQTLGGFGISIAAGIALPIFFPRSIEGEINRADGLRSENYNSRNHLTFISQERDVQGMYDLERQPDLEVDKTSITSSSYVGSLQFPPSQAWRDPDGHSPYKSPIRLEPNRRLPDVEEYDSKQPNLTVDDVMRLDSPTRPSSRVSRLVSTFRSPIDIRIGRP